MWNHSVWECIRVFTHSTWVSDVRLSEAFAINGFFAWLLLTDLLATILMFVFKYKCLPAWYKWWLLKTDLVSFSWCIFPHSNASVMHAIVKFSLSNILPISLHLFCFCVIDPLTLPTLTFIRCCLSSEFVLLDRVSYY